MEGILEIIFYVMKAFIFKSVATLGALKGNMASRRIYRIRFSKGKLIAVDKCTVKDSSGEDPPKIRAVGYIINPKLETVVHGEINIWRLAMFPISKVAEVRMRILYNLSREVKHGSD